MNQMGSDIPKLKGYIDRLAKEEAMLKKATLATEKQSKPKKK